MATVTICSDFGAQENSLSLFPFFHLLFAMKCGTRCHNLSFWMLSFKPVFHSPVLSSSRGSLVPLWFLPLEYHLHIWGCWYSSNFDSSLWLPIVIKVSPKESHYSDKGTLKTYPLSSSVCMCLVTQWCLNLCNPMDYIAHQVPLSMGILQASVLEWVAMPSSRGSSQPRDWTQVSRIAGRFFTIWATREAHK